MNNVIKLKKFDPIIEKYLSSQDKNAVKKTLAFEYFSNDFNGMVLEKIGMKRFESTSIEEFASDYNLEPQDFKLWKGQMLFMYKIDL